MHGYCLIGILSIISLHPSYLAGSRRHLSAPNHFSESGSTTPGRTLAVSFERPSWPEDNFVAVTDKPDPSKETALFWRE